MCFLGALVAGLAAGPSAPVALGDSPSPSPRRATHALERPTLLTFDSRLVVSGAPGTVRLRVRAEVPLAGLTGTGGVVKIRAPLEVVDWDIATDYVHYVCEGRLGIPGNPPRRIIQRTAGGSTPGVLEVTVLKLSPGGERAGLPTDVQIAFPRLPRLMASEQVLCGDAPSRPLVGDSGQFFRAWFTAHHPTRTDAGLPITRLLPWRRQDAREVIAEYEVNRTSAARYRYWRGGNTFMLPVQLTERTIARLQRGPIADAGGPYSSVRGGAVTLDASRSRPAAGGRLTAYRWGFIPGSDCPDDLQLANHTAEGLRVVVHALCSLRVSLTVRDSSGATGRSDTALLVRARRSPPFDATPVTTDPASAADPRWVAFGDPARPEGVNLGLGGLDVPNCRDGPGDQFGAPGVLCPAQFPTPDGRLRDKGFLLDRVRDPGGPFQGFWYVTATNLEVRRAYLLNPYLRLDGPALPDGQRFWAVNADRMQLAPEILAALQAHETWGLPGRPDTGHAGRMRQFFLGSFQGGETHDPRQNIEAMFGPEAKALTAQVQRRIGVIDLAAAAASRDPLPIIWGPAALRLFNPASRSWEEVTFQVPGDGTP